MKNIIKLAALFSGISLTIIPSFVTANTVGKITIAGDAQLTPSQLVFADNSAILTSTIFSGGVDTSGNLLPELGLNGPVSINPITLPPVGTIGNGRPVATISPLITDGIDFYPNNPGTDGSNLINGAQQFTGATFDGTWEATIPIGTYRFPGQISLSAQGLPGTQSFSVSGIAFDPVEFIPNEPVAVTEPTTILCTFLVLGTILFLKKASTKQA